MNLFEYTYDLVRQIPEGKISTYGTLAKALGDIVASRAVGRMMNQNPNADDMPCYKIVHSDGRLGGFGLGINDKIRRLRQDNILVKDGRIVDFENGMPRDSLMQKIVRKEFFVHIYIEYSDFKNNLYGAKFTALPTGLSEFAKDQYNCEWLIINAHEGCIK